MSARSRRSRRRSAFSGVWFLNGSYQWGCTARARDDDAPWLVRTLDWPFPGLGRHVEVARMTGDAGEFYSTTWPGFVGVLTGWRRGGSRPSINQAPMWRRTRHPWLRPLDMMANAVDDLAVAAHAAGSAAAPGLRDRARFRERAAPARDDADRAPGDLHARRLQGGRAVRDRAHRRTASSRARTTPAPRMTGWSAGTAGKAASART